MAWHLYRLGRWAFRRRRTVVALWLALLVAMGAGALTLSGKTSDDFSLPGVESVQAFDLIKERTPQAAPDGATAQVVFQVPKHETVTDPENKRSIAQALQTVQTGHVTQVASPYEAGTISQDGRTAYASVSYDRQSIELNQADRDALHAAQDAAAEDDVRVEIGGDALMQVPETGPTEMIGVLLALVILIVTFGSLVAAGMPLVTALIGVGIGVAGITTATGFMDLGSTTPILATMLGLAVGIDYALFIVSRYRHEIHVGHEPREAAGRAVGTAGSAVVFAGMTVVVALIGLSIVDISILTEMGLAAAATVLVAVLIALTLLPALFGFAGSRILAGRLPLLRGRDPEDADGRPTAGRRWGGFVTSHKSAVFVLGIAAVAILTIPTSSMRLALPDNGSQPADSTTRQAYDLVAQNFGAGANGPLMIVVDTKGAKDPQAAVSRVVGEIRGIDQDVARIVPPAPRASQDPKAAAAYEAQLARAHYATITVVPRSGPSDAETQDLVDRIRGAAGGVGDATGARVLVTGQTALSIDVSEALSEAFPRYLGVVVGLAFVILVLVFRSLLVPLKAVLGFLLSVGTALGATVAVFQWGWAADLLGVDQAGPVMSLLPLLLTGILFGLAMDYEVFLVSRMREAYVHGRHGSDGVVHGFQYGARVVTAAAMIMIGVFGSFAFGDDAMVKSIGFGLAVGILADAFLVRMTLVPAFMALLGDRVWWLPRWLDRLLPNLDVEGERLAEAPEPAREGEVAHSG